MSEEAALEVLEEAALEASAEAVLEVSEEGALGVSEEAALRVSGAAAQASALLDQWTQCRHRCLHRRRTLQLSRLRNR